MSCEFCLQHARCTLFHLSLYLSLQDLSVMMMDVIKKFPIHRDRRKLTPSATRLSSNITIVVDKMHFRGHTDKWCQENCNPFEYDGLHDVDISHLQLN